MGNKITEQVESIKATGLADSLGAPPESGFKMERSLKQMGDCPADCPTLRFCAETAANTGQGLKPRKNCCATAMAAEKGASFTP